jgi:hypothetical protein
MTLEFIAGLFAGILSTGVTMIVIFAMALLVLAVSDK